MKAWKTCVVGVMLAVFVVESNAFAASVIYQQKSAYRNILVVEQAGEGGKWRCMMFSRFRTGYQSCIDGDSPRLVLPYAQALMGAVLLQETLPKRVLILGLGGGSLPRALHMLNPQAEIDAVELDPAVAEVAQRFFHYRPDGDRSRLHVDDARMHVRRMMRLGQLYDLVIIDAFDKDYVPEHLLSRQFLQQVAGTLAPGGVVAANTFGNRRLSPYETATYRAVFGVLLQVQTTGGNRILFGRKGQRWPDVGVIKQRADDLADTLRPLGVASRQLVMSLRPVAPPVLDEEQYVLTDQFSPANLLLSRP